MGSEGLKATLRPRIHIKQSFSIFKIWLLGIEFLFLFQVKYYELLVLPVRRLPKNIIYRSIKWDSTCKRNGEIKSRSGQVFFIKIWSNAKGTKTCPKWHIAEYNLCTHVYARCVHYLIKIVTNSLLTYVFWYKFGCFPVHWSQIY